MAKSVLSDARFHNEQAAFDYVEAQLWATGPVCPHCGNADEAKIGRLQGKTTRVGLRKCYACRKPFTVRIGTIFEDSHLPLRLWLQAIHLLCASKKGISTRQLQRTLGCGMKTAWHLGHRIRLAMAPSNPAPLGGLGKVVEADETELARSRKTKRPANFRRKTHNPVVVRLTSMACASVVVETSEGDQSIGTAFHVGEGVYLTARHVLDGNRIIDIVPRSGGSLFEDELKVKVPTLGKLNGKIPIWTMTRNLAAQNAS